MKTIRTLAALVAAGAILGGCASSSPDPYYGNSNGGYRDGYRDNAAAGGRTADGDRLPPQRRIVALLDGRIERVHIHENDFPGTSLFPPLITASLC